MKKTIIAIPRGRIIKECQNILNKTTFAPDPLLFDENSRSLTFSSDLTLLNVIEKNIRKRIKNRPLRLHIFSITSGHFRFKHTT